MKFDAVKSITEKIQSTGRYNANKQLFAQEIGLHRETLINITKGKISTPNIYTVAQIADYFEISIDELVGRKVPSSKANALEKSPLLSENSEFQPKLFQAVLDYICNYVEERNIKCNCDVVINAIDSVYHYCVQTSSTNPDKKFADWILNKLLS